MVAILDYGVGNLLAVQNIIKRAGGKAVVTSDPSSIARANKLILPGVGSFAYGMRQLRQRGFVELLNEEVNVKRKVILGLCLGAQMMTTESEEGNCRGLAWVDAKTIKFDDRVVPITPHMNWAQVNITRTNPLFAGIGDEPRFYFVHSFHFDFPRYDEVIATAHYGYDFPCAFQRENIFGVQFHPEKSHRFGIKLFENFLAI